MFTTKSSSKDVDERFDSIPVGNTSTTRSINEYVGWNKTPIWKASDRINSRWCSAPIKRSSNPVCGKAVWTALSWVLCTRPGTVSRRTWLRPSSCCRKVLFVDFASVSTNLNTCYKIEQRGMTENSVELRWKCTNLRFVTIKLWLSKNLINRSNGVSACNSAFLLVEQVVVQ